MTMSVGSVTVNSDGTHSGSGAVKYVMDLLCTGNPNLINPAAPPPHPWPTSAATHVEMSSGEMTTYLTAQLVSQKQGIALQAAAIGGLIGYVLANGVVNLTIDTGPSFNGLQRLPASFVAGADCQAPTSPHALTGTIT